MEGDNFKLFLNEVEEKSATLGKEHPAWLAWLDNKVTDQQILTHTNKHGITAMPFARLT